METQTPATWKALPAIQRRILGVLVEKAKTTPDAYPLTLNALTTGCNQKNNREPHMNVSVEDVEDALAELRELRAVNEVHGDGRVPRYRHYMKDWMGVDGTELAVMAELLLRGPQTVGELRGRAARMASGQLPDLSALRPVLDSLIAKQLVVALSPAGRGQMVTHALFLDSEAKRMAQDHPAPPRSTPPPAAPAAPMAVRAEAKTAEVSPAVAQEVAQLRDEVADLRRQLDIARREIQDIWANLS